MKIISLFTLLLLSSFLNLNAQIFVQDFNSSALISDYVNAASPNSGQFNFIGSSGAGTAVSINNGKLRFNRTANAGAFSRSTDFSPVPAIISYQFDLDVSGNSSAQTTAAVFQVGSGFGSSNSAESNSLIHSKIGVNIGSTPNTFSLRDIGGGSNSATFTGAQTITWVINNSDGDISYPAPDGSMESLAQDKFDLWIGTSKEFDDRAAITETQVLSDLKFAFFAGTAIMDIDNVTISSDAGFVLPVALTSFTGKKQKEAVHLNWTTASEKNNSHFEVLHSADGKTFSQLTKIAGNGNSDMVHNYSYTDQNPFSGTNYYKLKQVDLDGKSTPSEVIAVNANLKNTEFNVYASKEEAEVEVSVYSPVNTNARFALFNPAGRKLFGQTLNLSKGLNSFKLPALQVQPGINIAILNTATENLKQKFIK
jgi:hypothetical protein